VENVEKIFVNWTGTTTTQEKKTYVSIVDSADFEISTIL
jgi:hypothetical protein